MISEEEAVPGPIDEEPVEELSTPVFGEPHKDEDPLGDDDSVLEEPWDE
jgi:hypothetical protein